MSFSSSPLLDVDPALPIDRVVPLVEQQHLARTRRLVPVEPWQNDGRSATAKVDTAERTSEWAHASWDFTVYYDDSTSWNAAWCVRLVLDERFKADVIRLGNTNIGLDHAIRIAVAELPGWQLEPWNRQGEIATTRGHRPAAAAGETAGDVR